MELRANVAQKLEKRYAVREQLDHGACSTNVHHYFVMFAFYSSSPYFGPSRYGESAFAGPSAHDSWRTFQHPHTAAKSQSQGRFRKTKQGGAASMRRSLFGSKTKTAKHHLTNHSTQRPVACKESTLIVREGGVSFA
eukprot:6181310-Pleurochrysis_carterae.AAC.4